MMRFDKSWVLGAALLVAAGWAQAAAAVTASLASPAEEGQLFVVSLQGTGFEQSVDGGGLNLTFDASALALLSVNIDPAWNFFVAEGAIDNTAGTLTDLSFNAWGGPSGDFQIANLTFLAKRGGTTTVSTAPSAMFPFGSGGEALPVTHGSLSISVVPEPDVTALALFGVAAGWGLAHRRRRAALNTRQGG
jgi:hypothetical protein